MIVCWKSYDVVEEKTKDALQMLAVSLTDRTP